MFRLFICHGHSLDAGDTHEAPQIYFAAAGVYSEWLEAGLTVR